MKRMTQGKEPNIVELIDEYNKFNDIKNDADKKCKNLGPMIKEYFQKNSLESFEGTNCVAKTSVAVKNSFNEEKLLEILKENGAKKAIKKVEVVDHEALENLLYHGKLNAKLLAPAQQTTTQVSLRMYAKKENKDG